MEIRPATPADLEAIEERLRASDLPTSGVRDHLATFYVLEDDGSILGVIGLEIYATVALLRSLAVSEGHRGRGLATLLCDRVEADALERGVQELYLLTETAQSFFAERGYALGSREAAPAEIAATHEFSEHCPQSAIFMHRAIEAP